MAEQYVYCDDCGLPCEADLIDGVWRSRCCNAKTKPGAEREKPYPRPQEATDDPA